MIRRVDRGSERGPGGRGRRDPLRGLLRLGLNESFAMTYPPSLLRLLIVLHPDLKTSIRGGYTAEVSRVLNQRKLDVAIVSQPCLESHVRAKPSESISSRGSRIQRFIAAARHLTCRSRGISSRDQPAECAGAQDCDGLVRKRRGQAHARQPLHNLAATIPMVIDDVAIGLIPIRVMRDHVRRRIARSLPISPAIGGHQVSFCYQASEFGPSLQRVLKLICAVITERGMFT
ncbi:MAG: LysR substrate-binding domain-containing protein [Acetobacteraceae bacterium]